MSQVTIYKCDFCGKTSPENDLQPLDLKMGETSYTGMFGPVYSETFNGHGHMDCITQFMFYLFQNTTLEHTHRETKKMS